MPENKSLPPRIIGHKTAMDWSLVLEAKCIPHEVEAVGSGFRILVEPGFEKAADRQILLYRREQLAAREHHFVPVAPVLTTGHSPLIAGFALFLFFLFGQSGPWGRELLTRGGGWASEILAGEWWRAVTSLTLHADIGHLASNLLFGSVIIGALQKTIGGGRAWLGTLTAGFLGNLLNAAFQGGSHRSIGASTAVFGALGLLVVLGIPVFHRRGKHRSWLPAGAGLALLVFLGFSPLSDISAHLLGFGAGITIGLPLSLLRKRPLRHPGWDYTGQWLTAAVLALCWAQTLL